MVTRPIEPVVVGVDGTLSSVRAVYLAAEEAGARVAPLVVVYTVEPHTDPALLPNEQRLLDLVVSRAQAEYPALSVEADLMYGDPVEALLRWSSRACLLVVGHHDGPRTRRSVAAEVAARSAVPVIVHRPVIPHDATAGAPVLIGLRGPAGGGQAGLAFAFAEAELRGAPVVACHVQSPGRVSSKESEHRLVEALDPWPARYPGVEVRPAVLLGTDVAAVLALATREAVLAVIGTDGHHAVAGRCLSPVTRDLLDTAGCPVAVIPH